MLIIGCDYIRASSKLLAWITRPGNLSNSAWFTGKRPKSFTGGWESESVTVRVGMESSGHHVGSNICCTNWGSSCGSETRPKSDKASTQAKDGSGQWGVR